VLKPKNKSIEDERKKADAEGQKQVINFSSFKKEKHFSC
jgi:hypothetical protein